MNVRIGQDATDSIITTTNENLGLVRRIQKLNDARQDASYGASVIWKIVSLFFDGSAHPSILILSVSIQMTTICMIFSSLNSIMHSFSFSFNVINTMTIKKTRVIHGEQNSML